MNVVELDPHQSDYFLGRPAKLPWLKKTQRGMMPLVACSLGMGAAILVACAAAGQLLPVSVRHTTVAQVIAGTAHPRELVTPLLADPAGLLLMVAIVACPYCAWLQANAIGAFNSMCARNRQSHTDAATIARVNEITARANSAFRFLGSVPSSMTLLGGSALWVVWVERRTADGGLWQSWNRSELVEARWVRLTGDGWWASLDRHPTLAVLAVLGGTYMAYLLCKQVLMGVIFAWASYVQLGAGFGVAPDVSANVDGHWGLRPLRRFMHWTYVSSAIHLAMLVAILGTWLPISQLSGLFLLGAVTVNIMVVIIPSVIAHRGSVAEKTRYVQMLRTGNVPEPSAQIEQAWKVPDLPFKPRRLAYAIFTSLLIPAALAAFASMLKS